MNTEEQLAWDLVAIAADKVADYYDPEDYDAGVIAVLAVALEIATGRKLKPLEDIWTTTRS